MFVVGVGGVVVGCDDGGYHGLMVLAAGWRWRGPVIRRRLAASVFVVVVVGGWCGGAGAGVGSGCWVVGGGVGCVGYGR